MIPRLSRLMVNFEKKKMSIYHLEQKANFEGNKTVRQIY